MHEVIRWHGLLRCTPMMRSEDLVVYGAKFGVVSLAKGPRIASIQEGLDCLGLLPFIRVLRESATLGWLWSFCRYRLMRIQNARVRLAISRDMSGISVTVPPR